ncbi:MAG: hypothetical protein ABIW76_06230 [Fibrobacteria bacterium]
MVNPKYLMARSWPGSVLAGLLCLAPSQGICEDWEQGPTGIFSYLDIGQIVKGTYLDAPTEYDIFSRMGAYLKKDATYKHRLQVSIELGGMFFNPYPPIPNAPWTFGFRPAPGLNEASALYRFGDTQSPSAEFQVGYFPVKYNPQATNLGEYLFRSNAYPNILRSGDWHLMNSANYRSGGLRFGTRHAGGAFRQDFFLLQEVDNYPTSTLSPAYVASLDLGGWIQLGGGVSWQHGIAFRPSLVTPKTPHNRILHFDDFPEVADQELVTISRRPPPNPSDTIHYGVVLPGHRAGTPWDISEVDLLALQQATNPYNLKVYTDVATGADTVLDATGHYADSSNYREVGNRWPRDTSYTSFRGLKFMARASLDFGILSGMVPGSFVLYMEAALLGAQNQAYYYTKVLERIPVMAGLRLPTFGVLDGLSLELEYFPSTANLSSALYMRGAGSNPVDGGGPIPNAPVDGRETKSSSAFDVPVSVIYYDSPDGNHSDDIKWSVLAKKTLFPGLMVYTQIASDHMRFRDFQQELLESKTFFQRPSEWYYLFRVEYGI